MVSESTLQEVKIRSIIASVLWQNSITSVTSVVPHHAQQTNSCWLNRPWRWIFTTNLRQRQQRLHQWISSIQLLQLHLPSLRLFLFTIIILVYRATETWLLECSREVSLEKAKNTKAASSSCTINAIILHRSTIPIIYAQPQRRHIVPIRTHQSVHRQAVVTAHNIPPSSLGSSHSNSSPAQQFQYKCTIPTQAQTNTQCVPSHRKHHPIDRRMPHQINPHRIRTIGSHALPYIGPRSQLHRPIGLPSSNG